MNITVGTIAGRRQRGLQLLILAVALLIGGALAAKLVFGQKKPSLTELKLLYPYGAGGKLPNGRTAPGAEELDFEQVGTGECGGRSCLKYRATKREGGFTYDMNVVEEDGDWMLAQPDSH